MVWLACKSLKSLARDRSAGPATEFALIGSVFFLILAAIFTLGLDMYWQMTLDTALQGAVRQVQIGKITSGAGFASAVCQPMALISGGYCANNLQYSVQGGTYFGSTSDSGSILGQAGSLTTTGLSSKTNFAGVSSSSATATSPTASQFFFAQVALPVPFSFDAALSRVVTQNGTSYIYSAASTDSEP
ncbi:TadE/TadG family type IV pilus assembly protein [Acidocella facilis]|uniref:TadE/TadG family type IV pilus assembly protein n=1 Tax=Acidocella facilis TaxID=525 RepID=UPI0004794D52|nr:TadE family protein [Acidocella facilis]